MVEALHLVVRLLEKVAVLVSATLVLLLLRPAEVWLGEPGPQASLRRRLFLVAVLGALAIWGAFLGFEIEGLRFNVRMVGVIVAGYLGGVWVGLVVGLAAGAVATFIVSANTFYVLAASILVGVVSGLWSRRWGTDFEASVIGAVLIQVAYHAGLGAILLAAEPQEALRLAGRTGLHAAKIAANAIGVTVFVGLLKLFREFERARREVEFSRAQVRSARLEALQYQVRPHFLFNLLNTLAYLIRTDATRARELTLDLAEFLRYTLSTQQSATTLADELEQIERYVELERARFGDGLTFSADPLEDPEIAQVKVPPLILQPLVENAIRHGSQDGEVSVEVQVQREGDELEIRVVDDGPGPPKEWPQEETSTPAYTWGSPPTAEETGGVGLENVNERLQRFYRGRSRLYLTDRPNDKSGACAQFRIPMGEADEPLGLKRQAREQLKKMLSQQESP
jgi:LytS/YehU family sensor histidine kinase